MQLPSQVQLIDVGPRDGLQNEKQLVPAAVKIELVHRLQAAGVRGIEVTSFVSPKFLWLKASLASRPDEIVVFAAASEAFSHKNINCSIAQSIERFAPVVQAALAAGIRVRGAMSCTVGCPYEGEIAPARVGYLAGLMRGIGVQHVGVADTIGVGTPRKVQAAFEATLQHFSLAEVSGHFHDTYGQALANTLAALEMGVYQFDASVAGLGGCPFAKGATGNVATEDVVYMLHGMGIDTGIDLDLLIDAGMFISDFLQRPSGSRAARALLTRRAAA